MIDTDNQPYIHPLDSKKRKVAMNSASTMQRLRSIANRALKAAMQPELNEAPESVKHQIST